MPIWMRRTERATCSRSIDDGTPQKENIQKYLEADLLDDYGFSEWVGPEPHGLGKHNMGTVKDPFTADETIDLLKRFDQEEGEDPWLTVCSFLNPHDDSFFGAVGLAQGLRYHPSQIPHVEQAPTHKEDLSSKPACQAAYNDSWAKMAAPQPWIQTHLKYYYQVQAAVGEQITRVLDALAASPAFEDTIVIFSSDHGDMQGAHGGMHEKWHVAYEEALHVPFIVSSPLLPGGEREIEIPTNHADLIPTLLGLTGIDRGGALAKLQNDHTDARPWSAATSRQASAAQSRRIAGAGPLHHRRRDQRGKLHPEPAPSRGSSKNSAVYSTVPQPNHIETVVAEVEVDGAQHRVKFSRYHDNHAVLDRAGRARRATGGPQDDSKSQSLSPMNSSSTTSRMIHTRNATSPTRITRTTPRVPYRTRCSRCSSISLPKSGSRRPRGLFPATGRRCPPEVIPSRSTFGLPVPFGAGRPLL